MAKTPQSLIVVGGGIVGLCVAVVAQARGHAVTLVTRDRPEDTASGIAAGMIAPVLESRSDPWNHEGLARMKRAQAAWLDLLEVWPQHLQQALLSQQTDAQSVFVWPGESDDGDDVFFGLAMGDTCPDDSDRASLRSLGIADGYSGLPVVGDWLIDARMALAELEKAFVSSGGRFLQDEACFVSRHAVRLMAGEMLNADHVVIAAGFDSTAFAEAFPVLARLHPIKGHLLDIAGPSLRGVVRSSAGYLAGYGDSAKFGASMEAGKADTAVDAGVVTDLVARARTLFPNLDLTKAVPRTGIRAATPDGWPIIGRDAESGIYIATGMRRNGYVFAPLAARIIADLIDGVANPDAFAYRPDRF